MKIVIDSNIWISVFLNKDFRSFIKHILEADINIVSSIQQLEEISAVLKRPKFQKYIEKYYREEFFLLFLNSVELIESKVKIKACRDNKDNFILEIAVSGEVNFIITEDNDLLVLNPFRDIRILTMKNFSKYLEQK